MFHEMCTCVSELHLTATKQSQEAFRRQPHLHDVLGVAGRLESHKGVALRSDHTRVHHWRQVTKHLRNNFQKSVSAVSGVGQTATRSAAPSAAWQPAAWQSLCAVTQTPACAMARLHAGCCAVWEQGAAHGLHGARVIVRRQVAHKQHGPPLVIRVVPRKCHVEHCQSFNIILDDIHRVAALRQQCRVNDTGGVNKTLRAWEMPIWGYGARVTES